MKVVSNLTRAILVITLLFLVGCASAPKPPIAKVSLNVKDNINLYTNENNHTEARPVVIRIYELNSLAAFNNADFFSIFNNYEAALGSEHLNSEEFQLPPGEQLKFDRTLHIDTRYIGVISAFRDLEHAQWRAATTVPLKESAPEIYIMIEGNKVMIGAKRACGFFCRIWSPKPPVGSLYEIVKPRTE